MAKASTTHVIEIETGIGEPAFIPLTLGQELQPISVGKKGMWRIESPRVLDVHAFVYFDGTSLFLQSADESSSASVDGYKVGKAWTELHAPCHIEIGAARLRYRSLLPEPAQPERPRANTGSVAGAPPRPATGAATAVGAPAPEPLTFPKADRPFAPGELATSTPAGESTRVSPLDAGGGRTATAPRPTAGRSIEEDKPTRIEGPGSSRNLNRASGVGPAAMLDGTSGIPPTLQGLVPVQPLQPIPHGMAAPGMRPPAHTGPMPAMMPGAPGVMPGAPGPMLGGPSLTPGAPPVMAPGAPPGMMPGTPGVLPSAPAMAPTPGPYPSYPGAAGSDPYNSLSPGVPDGYGSMTGGQMPVTTDRPLQQLFAKYKELSPVKRILTVLAPFCLLSAAYVLLFDDPPPIAAPPSSVQAVCPPGFVPYTAIEIPQGGVIPCVPAGTPMPQAPSQRTSPPATAEQPPPSATTLATAPPPPSATALATAPPPPATVAAAGNRTLERQAVDFVAAGDFARAAAVYEQLQAQNPNNPVYREAVRILRMKADAGTL
jgi:hypothetical protein